MKIAVVSRGYSYHKGGAERFTSTFCRKMSEAGHEVHLFCGEHVENVPPGVVFTIVNFVRIPSFLKIFSFHRAVRKLLSRENFDVIYGLCQFYPMDMFYAGGGVHRHWMRIQYPFFLTRLIKYIFSPVHLVMIWLEHRIFNPENSISIVTNSMLVRGHIQSYYGTPESKIHVIYDGVDVSSFNPAVKKHRKAMRLVHGCSEEDILVLFASNNWKRKGLDTIITAMSGLPEKYKLFVVGRGDNEKYSAVMGKKSVDPSRVVFAGVTDEIQKYYGFCDVFVLPTMYDPFAQVCREAMACGLPVITTTCNGAAEIIRHGDDGFILDSWKDSEKLKEFLFKLENKEVRQAMGEKAFKKVCSNTWQENIRQYLELLKKIEEK